jgi:CHAD domain-containing protein
LHQEFSRTVLRQRADALLSKLASLKRRATEKSIHDTRVQSRRMRAAIEAFQDLLAPHPRKALYDSVKEITRTLGKPRQTGVILTLLKDLGVTGDMAENLCREYLIERYQRKMRKQEKALKAALKTLGPGRLPSRIEFLLSGMELHADGDARSVPTAGSPRVRTRGKRTQSQPTLFPMQESDYERAQRILKQLAQPLLAFRPRYDFSRATDKKLHELRIAAKKLRYAMEIFDPIWPSGLKEQTAQCRAVQDAGGLYHDWSVLCERLKADIRRLDDGETAHLAFQIGRLLADAEDRRVESKTQILPALTTLQAGLLKCCKATVKCLDS